MDILVGAAVKCHKILDIMIGSRYFGYNSI